MIFYNSTVDEIDLPDMDTAVLPIGSVEQHGHHLPVSTDFIIASVVGSAIAERLKAYLLPTLPFSTCREHRGKKGSVGMSPCTFYHMISDIVMSLKDQGFKRVVIVLGHGGIFMAGPTVREINAVDKEIKVVKVDITQLTGSSEIKAIVDCKDNLHACEIETSLMLYINEELVRKDRIVDFIPAVPRDFLNYASIFQFCKDGVWGMPSLATKEKGERILLLIIDKSIDYINSIFKVFNDI